MRKNVLSISNSALRQANFQWTLFDAYILYQCIYWILVKFAVQIFKHFISECSCVIKLVIKLIGRRAIVIGKCTKRTPDFLLYVHEFSTHFMTGYYKYNVNKLAEKFFRKWNCNRVSQTVKNFNFLREDIEIFISTLFLFVQPKVDFFFQILHLVKTF